MYFALLKIKCTNYKFLVSCVNIYGNVTVFYMYKNINQYKKVM